MAAAGNHNDNLHPRQDAGLRIPVLKGPGPEGLDDDIQAVAAGKGERRGQVDRLAAIGIEGGRGDRGADGGVLALNDDADPAARAEQGARLGQGEAADRDRASAADIEADLGGELREGRGVSGRAGQRKGERADVVHLDAAALAAGGGVVREADVVEGQGRAGVDEEHAPQAAAPAGARAAGGGEVGVGGGGVGAAHGQRRAGDTGVG